MPTVCPRGRGDTLQSRDRMSSRRQVAIPTAGAPGQEAANPTHPTDPHPLCSRTAGGLPSCPWWGSGAAGAQAVPASCHLFPG